MGLTLATELLRSTVKAAAAGTALYGELYAGIDLDAIQTAEDLRVLPVVNKKELQKAGPSAIDGLGVRPIAHVQFTSGSTGVPLSLYRSVEEVEFIFHFFAILSGNRPMPRAPEIALQFSDSRHGTPTAVPGSNFVVRLALRDRSTANFAVQQLSELLPITGTDGQIHHIGGSYDDILAFSEFAKMEHAADPIRHSIASISSVGRYMTERSRHFMASFWEAPVIDRYSLTEVFGGATFCLHCLAYHFDACVIPEIVDSAGQPERSSAGSLVLTSLRPFTIMHPMIRYDTGDLFQYKRSNCGREALTFMGRNKHALRLQRTRALALTGVDVIEVLDNVGGLVRDVSATSRAIGATGSSFGRPRSRGRVRYQGVKTIATLEVEVSSHEENNFSDRLRDEICHRLHSRVLTQSELSTGVLELGIELKCLGQIEEAGREQEFWVQE